MKNGTILLSSVISFGVAWSIMNGTAQEVVHFADELNEIGCFVIAFTMGVLSLMALDYRGLWNWLKN